MRQLTSVKNRSDASAAPPFSFHLERDNVCENAFAILCVFWFFTDMIAATSVLQQQAADIRTRTINWASYMQSQMITQEDFQAISSLDKSRAAYLAQNSTQVVKTLLNLVSHLSKDSTIQYILVLLDDLLQEDRSRVDLFHETSGKIKQCVWGPFLNLLNRQDGFIVNMASRILAKFACWGHETMPKSDLNFYLQFLKDQLAANVSRTQHNLFASHAAPPNCMSMLYIQYLNTLPCRMCLQHLRICTHLNMVACCMSFSC